MEPPPAGLFPEGSAFAMLPAGARMVELVDTGDSISGLPRGNTRVRNRVNSGKPKPLQVGEVG